MLTRSLSLPKERVDVNALKYGKNHTSAWRLVGVPESCRLIKLNLRLF